MVSKTRSEGPSYFVTPESTVNSVRCVVIRGGTSRGLFFHERDLPSDPQHRDGVIMAAIGAPDPRQVDGMGGGDMLLSKVCIVSRSPDSGVDVECEFANVTPGKERPTWGTNCGNLVAAVAIFAVDEGLVPPDCEMPTVRIRNRNSQCLIAAQIQPIAKETSDIYDCSGMTDTGSCVHMDFLDPVGTVQEHLLPTGNVRDSISLSDGTSVDITIIDAGAMYVFVKADDIGLSAVETAAQMEGLPETMENLEFIRATAAQMVGLVTDRGDATHLTPDIPKLAFVAPARTYCIGGSTNEIGAQSIDLVSRIVSSQKYHNAYAVTAAIATAAAAAVSGSTVHEASGTSLGDGMQTVRIGHPTGIMECAIEKAHSSEILTITRARITRTARRIMQGTLYLPNNINTA